MAFVAGGQSLIESQSSFVAACRRVIGSRSAEFTDSGSNPGFEHPPAATSTGGGQLDRPLLPAVACRPSLERRGRGVTV